MRPRPLLIALAALAFSGCIYTVEPAPKPQLDRPKAPLPLRVAVIGNYEGAASGRAAMKMAAMAQSRSGAPGAALAKALRDTGLFQSVQNVSSAAGYDVVIQWTEKQDRSMHSFFPFFLPFCDPMIIGCLPFYPVTERFTADAEAVLVGGGTYNAQGEAKLRCMGPLGCAPASSGDPAARAAAVEDAAAKIAADLLRDADYFRGIGRPKPEAVEEAPRPKPAAPPQQQTQPADKPWWQQ